MDSQRRSRVGEVLSAALRRPAGERGAYIAGACAGDVELEGEVRSLLEAVAGAGAFLGSPTAPGQGVTGSESPGVGGVGCVGDVGALAAGWGAARGVGGVGGAVATAVSPPGEGPGSSIGPYKLLQVIGEGGFGTVFMAEQTAPVVRRVALKIIKLGMDTRQVIARFEAERQALAMMDHPNIARVLDAGATGAGRPYFVMELVKGDPITAYCDTNNLSIPERLELFAQVCVAVQHAHTKGIIHRDLKPSNILVSTLDGRPSARVIDFGIAKATAARLTEKTLFTEHRALIGTPEYMSPEQAEGSLDIDTRTDVYSLGVLLYELLTGATPFDPKRLRSAAYAEIQRIIREVEPPRPSTRLSQNTDTIASVAAKRHTEPRKLGAIVQGELDWIVMKALEKDRSRRYETANGLGADVRRYLTGEAVVAAPPSRAYRARTFVRRHKAAVVSVALFAALTVVYGAFATWSWLEQARLRDEADRARAAEARQRRAVEVERDRAIAAEKAAAQNAENEAKARQRTEAINDFVTASLKSSDPNVGGRQGTTILQAMQEAIRDIESGRFKDDPETEAGLLNTIGTIIQNNGHAEQALPRFEAVLELRQRLYTGDHPLVAQALNNLGFCLDAMGRSAEALPRLRAALEMNQRLQPGDHEDVAINLSAVANCLRNLGRSAEALPMHEAALEMFRRLFPGDFPDVATSLNDLAGCLDDLARSAEALPKFESALAMNQRLHPGDHPAVATALNNVALCLNRLGRSAEALSRYEDALQMWQRLYAGDHPDVAAALNNVADCLNNLGRPAEALPKFQAASEMIQRLFPGDHPHVASSLNNLAFCLGDLGRWAEALPIQAAALEMNRRLFPGDNEGVAMCLMNLAKCLAALDRLPEALDRARESAEMADRVLPEGHPLRKACDHALADISKQAGVARGP